MHHTNLVHRPLIRRLILLVFSKRKKRGETTLPMLNKNPSATADGTDFMFQLESDPLTIPIYRDSVVNQAYGSSGSFASKNNEATDGLNSATIGDTWVIHSNGKYPNSFKQRLRKSSFAV